MILPPWLFIAVMVILNLWKYDLFVKTVTAVVDWILNSFAWMFNGITLAATVIVVICYVTPIKNIRFGGAKARPMISYKSYVWIVLCTIMGAGLMLWACAEPVIHLHNPSVSVAAGAMSAEAVHWAMENLVPGMDIFSDGNLCAGCDPVCLCFLQYEEKSLRRLDADSTDRR